MPSTSPFPQIVSSFVSWVGAAEIMAYDEQTECLGPRANSLPRNTSIGDS